MVWKRTTIVEDDVRCLGLFLGFDAKTFHVVSSTLNFHAGDASWLRICQICDEGESMLRNTLISAAKMLIMFMI